MSRRLLALLLVALSAGAPGASAAENDFYAHKTITVVVGLNAGGTADLLARQLAIHLRRYIPGEPTIIVQNMPGGSGVVATNYIYERAKPDGMTILWGPWDPLSQLLGNQPIRARYERFAFLGATSDIRVNYARTDIVSGGLKRPADIVHAKEVLIGESSVTGFSGLLARLSMDVLGVPNRLVTGYAGGTEAFLALQRGEVNFHNVSLTAFRGRIAPFIKSGGGMGINYFVAVDASGRFERDPSIPEMPAFPDLYADLYGKSPVGPVWDALNWLSNQIGAMAFVALAPPDTPAPAVALLRTAYEAVAKDPDFVRESVASNGSPYGFIGVARGETILRALTTVSPEIRDTLRRLVEASH